MGELGVRAKTHPQHLLGGGGIFLEGLEQLEGILGGIVGVYALCEGLDVGFELTLIHDGRL